MLLNEFKQTPLTEYESASKLLESAYGVKIKPTKDMHKLYMSAAKAQTILENLKYQNRAIDDAEVSKYTLINETIMSLIESNYDARIQTLLEFEGVPSINVNSSKFRRNVDGAVAKAIGNYDSGMPIEDVANNALHAFRNTPGIVTPGEVFKVEFEKAFLKKLYFSGREPEMDNQPSHYDTVKPATHLFDDMTSEEIVEAIEQMEAINEGLLTEAEVDNDQLVAIAEALLAEWDASDLQLVRQKNSASQDAADRQGVKVDFGKKKPMSPKDHATVQKFKKQFAAQANEEAVDEGPDSFMKSEKKPSPEAAAFRKRMQAKKGN